MVQMVVEIMVEVVDLSSRSVDAVSALLQIPSTTHL